VVVVAGVVTVVVVDAVVVDAMVVDAVVVDAGAGDVVVVLGRTSVVGVDFARRGSGVGWPASEPGSR
jgi:hypothetical protein